MWRTRAILALLVNSVAALRAQPTPASERTSEEGNEEASEIQGPETALQLATESAFDALHQAQKRATLSVAVDWIAIAVLFLFRPDGEPFLTFDANPRTVFSAGILAVAIHSGFRLGQLEKYRAVERACRELSERDAS